MSSISSAGSLPIEPSLGLLTQSVIAPNSEKTKAVAQASFSERETNKKASAGLGMRVVNCLTAAGTAFTSLVVDIVRRCAYAVQRLACRTLNIKMHVDRYKFLKGTHTIRESEREWHINLALLRSAERATSDPAMIKKIRFLQTNYLKKVAPIYMKYMRLLIEKLKNDFRLLHLSKLFTIDRDFVINWT